MYPQLCTGLSNFRNEFKKLRPGNRSFFATAGNAKCLSDQHNATLPLQITSDLLLLLDSSAVHSLCNVKDPPLSVTSSTELFHVGPVTHQWMSAAILCRFDLPTSTPP